MKPMELDTFYVCYENDFDRITCWMRVINRAYYNTFKYTYIGLYSEDMMAGVSFESNKETLASKTFVVVCIL